MGKDHAPSTYRKIIKASKSGKVPVSKLIEEARALSDSYYISMALFGLSMNPELDKEQAANLRQEALEYAEEEHREWRRAELITSLAKNGKDLRDLKDLLPFVAPLGWFPGPPFLCPFEPCVLTAPDFRPLSSDLVTR